MSWLFLGLLGGSLLLTGCQSNKTSTTYLDFNDYKSCQAGEGAWVQVDGPCGLSPKQPIFKCIKKFDDAGKSCTNAKQCESGICGAGYSTVQESPTGNCGQTTFDDYCSVSHFDEWGKFVPAVLY